MFILKFTKFLLIEFIINNCFLVVNIQRFKGLKKNLNPWAESARKQKNNLYLGNEKKRTSTASLIESQRTINDQNRVRLLQRWKCSTEFADTHLQKEAEHAWKPEEWRVSVLSRKVAQSSAKSA